MVKDLETYNKKRKFDKTGEPKGEMSKRTSSKNKKKNPETLRFVVQHHMASRDHYDFRLEWDGTLKCWAVPKGPSYSSGDKRLAVQVEDHPIDYRSFEGTIPKGEYGGGTVMVWDEGTWEPHVDVEEGLKDGSLKLKLKGERLVGNWALVRMKPRKGEKDNNWLLIKERDDYTDHADINDYTTSVKTGRTMPEIKSGDDPKETKQKNHKSSDKTKRTDKGGTKKRTGKGDNKDGKKSKSMNKKSATNKGKTNTNGKETKSANDKKKKRKLKKTVEDVDISSPDKVLFEKAQVTKGELAKYYEKVAERMLHYLENRVLSTVRCPEGIDGSCFFRKHPANEKGVETVKVESEDSKSDEYFYITDATGLMAEVQMNTIEFHPWGSRIDTIEKPDTMIFDLDPDEGMGIDDIRRGVKDLKDLLDDLSLKSYLKTSGGKGYHIVIPLKPSVDWDTFHDFAKNIAKTMASKWPDRYTNNVRKENRKGRIFIDWMRNGRGSTSVAPYSVRARENVAVSMPIKWSELDKVEPHEITMDEAIKRLRRKDPWEGYFDNDQELR